jgi:hypothetical protein
MRELLCLNVYRILRGGDGIGSFPLHLAIFGAQSLDACRRLDFPFPALFAQPAYGIENSPMRRIVAHVIPSALGAEL